MRRTLVSSGGTWLKRNKFAPHRNLSLILNVFKAANRNTSLMCLFTLIISLLRPLFFLLQYCYIIELWFYTSTQTDRDELLKNFSRNWYVFDCNALVDEKIFSTASNIIDSDNHILSERYQSNRKFYRLPKTRCTRFFKSFVPKSTKILNSKGGKLK